MCNFKMHDKQFCNTIWNIILFKNNELPHYSSNSNNIYKFLYKNVKQKYSKYFTERHSDIKINPKIKFRNYLCIYIINC